MTDPSPVSSSARSSGVAAGSWSIPTVLGWTAVYTVGTLAFLWPLPTRFTTHIWGDRFDAWTTLWLIQHLADGIRSGTLAADTNAILFPVGYNLWSFGHAALQLIGAVLVAGGVPLILAYNLLLVAGLVTSALGAHAFGRTIGGSHAAGVVAAVPFATSPYLYGEGAAGCIELVAAGLLPLFGLTLVRLAREPGPRRAAAAAAVLALIGPFNWYYTLFAGMFGVGFCAWTALARNPKGAGWMVVAFVVAGLADAPLIPLVRRETPERPPLSSALFTDPAAWDRARDLADGRMPLDALQPAALEEHDAMQVIQNSTRVRSLLSADFVTNPLDSTPGRFAWVLGLAGAFAAGRRARGWLWIAAGATVLTLGPYLTLDDTPPLPQWSADNPLPYAWAYTWVPFFAKAYRPYRIGVVALLALSGAAAAGAARFGLSLRRPAHLVGVGLLGVAGFTQPLWAGERPAWRPLADATISPGYTALRDAAPGAVVELPLHYQPLSIANARFQYSQVAHGHPVLNCNQLIRRTDLLAFRDYVAGNGLLSAFVDIARREDALRWTDADLHRLVEDGFRWVVVHHRVSAETMALAGKVGLADMIGQPAIGMLRDTFGSPEITDDEMWAFRIPDAWPDEGRRWTWSTSDVEDVDTPWDTVRYGVTLPLRAGSALMLSADPGPGTLSFWMRPSRGDLVLRSATSEVALRGDPSSWTWAELDGEGPFQLAATSDAEVALTRVQRVRR